MICSRTLSYFSPEKTLRKPLLAVAIAALALNLAVFAVEKPKAKSESPAASPAKKDFDALDYETISRLRGEAFRRSEVMKTLSELTDEIGPRLTNSPNQKRAAEWAAEKMKSYGLQNVHLEPWGTFGKGWSYQVSHIRMTAPDTAELLGLPKAWTPSTNGVIKGKAVHIVIKSKDDFAKYKGKLAGMIVLNGEMRKVDADIEPLATRYSDKDIEKLSMYNIPGERDDAARQERFRRTQLAREVAKFFAEEKVAAVLEGSRAPFDGGTIGVQGNGQAYKEGEPVGVPNVVLAIEHFGRITRLLDRNVPVELELDVQTQFTDNGGDLQAYNVIGEIPGTDLKDQVVMIGGHLDSWHAGTGATDNAAGCSVMLETMRIFQKLGIKPRRTLRIALWTGEEEGLLGSRGWVAQHLATKPVDPKEANLPEFMRRQAGPLELKPEHGKVSIYFNVDSGTGKIRGVSLQENQALAPIFREWMEPYADLGMSLITMNNSGGSDFLSFDGVGVPGIDFIQDEVEYESRTHHSNMDVYERIQRDDMLQAVAIVGGFAYQAAQRNEMMPRKPLPQPEPPPATPNPQLETKPDATKKEPK
jgi:hypothetical protein